MQVHVNQEIPLPSCPREGIFLCWLDDIAARNLWSIDSPSWAIQVTPVLTSWFVESMDLYPRVLSALFWMEKEFQITIYNFTLVDELVNSKKIVLYV